MGAKTKSNNMRKNRLQGSMVPPFWFMVLLSFSTIHVFFYLFIFKLRNLHAQFSKPITGKGNEVWVGRRAHEENGRGEEMRAHLRKGSAHLVMRSCWYSTQPFGTKQEGFIF
jgi:hypothetical protein